VGISRKLESALNKKIKAKLSQIPGIFFFKAADRHTAGIPDYIICWDGKFIAIESKRAGEKPRKLQEFVIDKINKSGGIAIYVDNYQSFEEFVSKTFYQQ